MPYGWIFTYIIGNICMSAVAMSLRWVNRCPWASCFFFFVCVCVCVCVCVISYISWMYVLLGVQLKYLTSYQLVHLQENMNKCNSYSLIRFCLYFHTVCGFTVLHVHVALGPVVQSIVSLTSSLMTSLLTVIAIFKCINIFPAKMRVAFAKAIHIFSAKISMYLPYFKTEILTSR